MTAKNWKGKDARFAGIDIGGAKKGFHLCLINEEGAVTDIVRLKTAESVSQYLKEQKPSCIAIDGPARSVRKSVKTREAERQIRMLDYRMQWTPQTGGRAQEWMEQSGYLWTVLRRDFPQIPICETFPTAIQDRVLTEEVQLPLAMLQSRLLREHTKDFLDAILAATAARRIHRNEAEVFGVNDEIGSIYLPADPFRDYTLTLIVAGGRILLGHKKRGLGEGYYNGFGGKVEADETIAAAAVREIFEEVGLRVKARDLIPAGLLYFTFADSSIRPIRGTVFRAENFSGEPLESDEMTPQWFAINAIPYDRMWGDDIFWLPLMLEKRPFVASFHVGMDNAIERRTLVETEAAFATIQRRKSRRPFSSI